MQYDERTLYGQVLNQCNLTPAVTAILAPGRIALTYQGLAEHLDRTVASLASAGICPGKRVAVVLPNGPEMATCFQAVSSVTTCAPLNPAYSLNEFEFYLSDLKASALIVEQGSGNTARQAAGNLGVPLIELLRESSTPAGFFSLGFPVERGDGQPVQYNLPEDIAMVLHTSGTTSRPKIVPLKQVNLGTSARNIATSLGLTPLDRCLNVMPLFHIHGLMAAVMGSLVSGGSVICTSGMDPSRVLDWLVELEPTWMTAVPTMLQVLLERGRSMPEQTAQLRLRFLRACSSALSAQLAEDLESLFCVPVIEAYGMTEASHQIAVNPLPPRAHKFGSVGLATGDEVTILDPQGRQLPARAVGEISIRGANVMGGYESNPQANETAFTNGWLRTGDQGYLDEEGYIFIRGRVKEIINRGGEKISPREIDEVLLRHPDVAQAVAFAVPHASLGEDVAAAVVMRPGASVTLPELVAFASQSLAYFKVPRRIVMLTEIPKGPTGKIQRIGLADKLAAQLQAASRPADRERTPPVTATETAVLGVWQDVLLSDAFGTNDDFLSIGGDSLKAMQVLVRLNEIFGLQLTIREIFDLPTVQALSAEIDRLTAK
jgi:acyl-CoA synthetase (AMP-forming)/AMP-acid ligase II/acyl carrier protein